MAEKEQVISKLTSFSQERILSDVEKCEYAKLQNELHEIYRRKSEGAYLRPRSKWLKEGEKNYSYFFRLDNRQFHSSSLDNLKIVGTITEDPKKIIYFCVHFFKKTYS